MADKNKKGIKDTRDKSSANKPIADETRSGVKRFGESRRRLPLAALLVLIALIGVGVYFAWPSIQGSVESKPPDDVIASTKPEPAVKSAPTAPAEPSPTLVALGEQVTALENALATQRTALKRAEAHLATANTSLQEPDPKLFADIVSRLEGMEERLIATNPAAQAARVGADKDKEGVATTNTFQTLERLASLERALSRIENSDSSREIDSLKTELTNLRKQITSLRQSAEIKDLKEEKSGHTIIMVLAYTRLSRATALASPFAREVKAFVAAAQANGQPSNTLNNAMAKLDAHALAGTPTHADLTSRFDDMALAVVKADADADDQSWVDATIGRLRRIVTVRRIGGEIAIDSLEGQLHTVHQALSGGNLADAIAVIDALPEKSRRGAEVWLRDARARLAVEQALDVIEAEVANRAAAHWSPPTRNEE